MMAGNKQNKKMPMVKRTIYGENVVKEGLKVGQVYMNGIGRRKIKSVNRLTGAIAIRQWGDVDARDLNVNRKDFGGWELIHENKVLKITEDQLKKILEIDNLTSTAYPDGEMIDFDDCVKYNNNRVPT